MTDTVRQLIIQGVTANGRRFRPSDWAERLSGVMSQFRPPGARANHLTYSPYAFPTVIDGIKCVVVDERLRELEPLAWKFVVDFASDNNLVTTEVCMLPEAPTTESPNVGTQTSTDASTTTSNIAAEPALRH